MHFFCRVRSVLNNLLGKSDSVSLETRIFHAVCLVTLVVIAVNVPFNLLIGLPSLSVLMLTVDLLVFWFYYLSRVRKQTGRAIFYYNLLSNTFLVVNYYLNSGSYGPTVLIFVLSIFLVIAIAPPGQSRIWVPVNIAVVIFLLILEYLVPSVVSVTYTDRLSRFLDLIYTYFIVVGVIFFITRHIRNSYNQQKEQERLLRQLAEQARLEAEKANEAKSVFLATMSHEIRTPMNGVMGMASLLNETQLNHEQQDYLQSIRTSADALLAVINDILDFSKIESGMMELDIHSFDLRQCVEEAVDLFAVKADASGVDLLCYVDHKLPPLVLGDSLRLRQILINLVGNALKFTAGGEVFLRVIAGTDQDIVFEVKDTGIGIPEDKISRLFSAFSQVDSSTTRRFGGTGLGLVISRRLVNLMGGEITVESVEGVGSTFRFNIKAPVSEERPLPPEEASLQCKRILVADDNRTSLYILEEQLRQWKIESVCVASGAEALLVLSTDANFDLILTDIKMPGPDGIELARAVRKDFPQVPVVLLCSAACESRSMHPELFAAVLTKPVRQMQLFGLLQNLLKADPSTKNAPKKAESVLAAEFAERFPLDILLAEDNLINQKLALRVLQKLGYQAELARNGKEAVDMARVRKFDLILMDMLMPEMDGLAATREIRRSGLWQPRIVAMTANAMNEDREQCLRAGMDDYLTKPFTLERLMEVLGNVAKHTPGDKSAHRSL